MDDDFGSIVQRLAHLQEFLQYHKERWEICEVMKTAYLHELGKVRYHGEEAVFNVYLEWYLTYDQ